MTASILSRLILRYLAGALIAKGFLDSDLGTQLFTDPQVQEWLTLVLGSVAAAVAEYWYKLAKRFGWST